LKSLEKKSLIQLREVGLTFQQGKSIKFFKKKQKHIALKNVSFEVYPGEILGVVGRNGSGKSTTLSLIAGVIKPDKGSVSTEDVKVNLLNFTSGMIPYLSGRDNIYLQGYFLNMTKTEIQDNLDKIIEVSELGKFIDEPVNTYSTGMRAKLGFAIAYFSLTDVLLIDETLGVGDFKFKKKSSEMMKSKIRENAAAIIVTHDEALLKSMCTKCVLIHQGESVLTGSPEEVLKLYHSLS